MPPELVTISRESPGLRRRQVRATEPQTTAETESLWVEVTPLMFLTGTVEPSIRRLQELAALPQNWDSYGSPPPQRNTLEMAYRILKLTDVEGAPVPFISPTAGGGIQFSWERTGKTLEVSVRPDGTLEFLAEEERARPAEGVMPHSHVQEVRALINWFLST
jgi:hypothetical protein